MRTSDELKDFRVILETLGLPQTSVAKRLHISPSYFNRVLSGVMVPSDELMERIRDLRDRLKKTGLIAV